MRDLFKGSNQPVARPFDRRLFGAVLRAFHKAIDHSDHPAAAALYEILSYLVTSSATGYGVEHRRSEQELADAATRLGFTTV